MTEHSPLPWHFGPRMKPSYDDHGWRRLAMMTDNKTCIYARKGEWQLNWPHEGNAALIVSAVNQAPLLGELEEALAGYHLDRFVGAVGHPEGCATCALLRRARQVREGTPDDTPGE